MNFIRKHKFTVGVLIVLFIIAMFLIALIRFLMPNYNGDLYGNRLSGMSHYAIDDSVVDKLKTELSTAEEVEEVLYDLEGKLIDITIKVKDEVERDVAKGYADKSLTYFTDEQRGYFDIQVFITSSNPSSEKYPIVGYKHKTSGGLVWSNN